MNKKKKEGIIRKTISRLLTLCFIASVCVLFFVAYGSDFISFINDDLLEDDEEYYEPSSSEELVELAIDEDCLGDAIYYRGCSTGICSISSLGKSLGEPREKYNLSFYIPKNHIYHLIIAERVGCIKPHYIENVKREIRMIEE